MNKKKLAVFLTGLFCISVLIGAETLTSNDEENSSITIQTFYTLKNSWTDFTALYQENAGSDEIASALSEYQNQLLKGLNTFLQSFPTDVTNAEGDEGDFSDFYPFILSEIYFYKHIVANKPSFGIITHLEIDEAIETVMEIVVSSDIDSGLSVSEKLYTVNALFSYFDVATEHKNILPTKDKSLNFPSDYEQQVLLVTAFSQLDILQANKVSIENIVRLLDNPLAVFLTFYYPPYEYLKDDVLSAITAYEEIFENPVAADITENALAAYDAQRLFNETELSSQTYGIPIESILPPKYESLYAYFRTAPLMSAAFTQNELVGFNSCLDYLSVAGELYVSRINSLAFRPISEGADNE